MHTPSSSVSTPPLPDRSSAASLRFCPRFYGAHGRCFAGFTFGSTDIDLTWKGHGLRFKHFVTIARRASSAYPWFTMPLYHSLFTSSLLPFHFIIIPYSLYPSPIACLARNWRNPRQETRAEMVRRAPIRLKLKNSTFTSSRRLPHISHFGLV